MAGEMARLRSISKQTLIYYDRIGLFKPNEIDPETGYRYYSIDQWEELEIILCLKNLGMQLKEIKAYLSESPQRRVELLEAQETVIHDRLRAIHVTRKRVGHILNSLKNSISIEPFKTEITWIDALPVMIIPIQPPGDFQALEQALRDTALKTRQEPDFLVPDFFYQVDDTHPHHIVYERAAVPTDRSLADDIIPKGYWARIYHKGPMETIDDSRQRLRAFIRESGYLPQGNPVERMIFTGLADHTKTDHCLEIRIPVTRETCMPPKKDPS